MPEVYPFERGAEAFPFVRRAFHPPASSCGAYRQSWRLEDGSEVVIERGDLTRTGPCMVYFYGPHEPRLTPPQPTTRMKEKA
jgi:hypothetical protein